MVFVPEINIENMSLSLLSQAEIFFRENYKAHYVAIARNVQEEKEDL